MQKLYKYIQSVSYLLKLLLWGGGGGRLKIVESALTLG